MFNSVGSLTMLSTCLVMSISGCLPALFAVIFFSPLSPSEQLVITLKSNNYILCPVLTEDYGIKQAVLGVKALRDNHF